jgi:hypothetical protein
MTAQWLKRPHWASFQSAVLFGFNAVTAEQRRPQSVRSNTGTRMRDKMGMTDDKLPL